MEVIYKSYEKNNNNIKTKIDVLLLLVFTYAHHEPVQLLKVLPERAVLHLLQGL